MHLQLSYGKKFKKRTRCPIDIHDLQIGPSEGQFKKRSSTASENEPACHPPTKATIASASTVETTPTTTTSTARDDQSKGDFLHRVPVGWAANMSEGDRLFYGRTLFISKGRLKDGLQLWWHPPQPSTTGKPVVSQYFSKRLFLWMPRRMYQVDFLCPTCNISLRSKGIYNRVRLVLDVSDFYYLAAEYMDCKQCRGTFISYDDRMMNQLTDAMRVSFPALLTRKYACDRSVLSLLRARTLGNSSTAMQHNILERHSEQWLGKQLQYLSACKQHQNAMRALNMPNQEYEETVTFKAFPTARWFLACYVRDVWGRIEMLKAALTSVYGTILKIDSTKKVCKKLQGLAAGSAQWCTNVGNERGEILQSVLTTSESISSCQDLANGLMKRFETAQQAPPTVLYTDRDCCKIGGDSKFKILFSKWEDLEVRLDIFHFMRRLALGCTTESHPLYGVFMSRLSSVIFEWDSDDLKKLQDAKKKELEMDGIPNPSLSAVQKAITKEELERYCKRQTRGTQKTTDGVQLYTQTGTISKGGIALATYRCGRGTTSLESLHLHLARLIPGTSANAVNFQAFLLDGLYRWNLLRAATSAQADSGHLRTFDLRLSTKVNALSQQIHGKKIIPQALNPAEYTGETIGVEYLYKQSGLVLPDADDELMAQIDEGFEDEEGAATDERMESALDHSFPIPDPPFTDKQDGDQEDVVEEDPAALRDAADIDCVEDVSTDSRGIPGWEKVAALAQALLDLKGISLTSSDAKKIIKLYDDLADYDKQPLTYRLRMKASRGRFARSKHGYVGAEVVKRCFLSAGSPASYPNKSRVVEALCILLCEKIPQARKDDGYTSRWRLILSEYNKVRQRLLNSEDLLEGTELVLLHLNEATLTRWFKEKTRRDEVTMLLQGRQLPPSRVPAEQPLPPAKEGPSRPVSPLIPFQFPEPEDRTGLANVRRKNVPSTSGSSTAAEAPGVAPPAKVSRTTEWRKRKAQALAQTLAPGTAKLPRKEYSCRVCGKGMSSTGHTQFRGKRYCPDAPGQVSKDEWLAKQRAEAAQAKLAKQNKD
ncbi:hypothetical protein BSL78_18257 [Apostichopus japonicus]|uniref:DUF6729 domain-containing protein n=1 Tax=Stichopus japonicus TaxID=307972 RepID=A0A2G8KA50_STIJA|nr:hypothetical protein BSL78_18257 [Apostichopus japonicus]